MPPEAIPSHLSLTRSYSLFLLYTQAFLASRNFPLSRSSREIYPSCLELFPSKNLDVVHSPPPWLILRLSPPPLVPSGIIFLPRITLSVKYARRFPTTSWVRRLFPPSQRTIGARQTLALFPLVEAPSPLPGFKIYVGLTFFPDTFWCFRPFYGSCGNVVSPYLFDLLF